MAELLKDKLNSNRTVVVKGKTVSKPADGRAKNGRKPTKKMEDGKRD